MDGLGAVALSAQMEDCEECSLLVDIETLAIYVLIVTAFMYKSKKGTFMTTGKIVPPHSKLETTISQVQNWLGFWIKFL